MINRKHTHMMVVGSVTEYAGRLVHVHTRDRVLLNIQDIKWRLIAIVYTR